MPEVIRCKSLPTPKFRYSSCVKAGPLYQFAGMIALDGSGQIVGGGPEAETRLILKTMREAMTELGMSLGNLLSATIYTTRFQDFPLINKAWEEVFTTDVTPPARTSIGVAALPLGATVEIEFRAYQP